MKAAYITQPGPPESIIIGDLPTPEPTGDQVLVRVKAAAVNPIDTYVRSGTIKMDIPLPFIVGCDLAGVVEKVGPNATKFKVGDRVWGTNQGLMGRQGTFAEFAAVEERWLYPIPAGVNDETAAACALVGITATSGSSATPNCNPVKHCSSTAAPAASARWSCKWPKALGARVITTAGTD